MAAEDVGSGICSLPEHFGFLDERLVELDGLRGLRELMKDPLEVVLLVVVVVVIVAAVWVRDIWKSSSSSLPEVSRV